MQDRLLLARVGHDRRGASRASDAGAPARPQASRAVPGGRGHSAAGDPGSGSWLPAAAEPHLAGISISFVSLKAGQKCPVSSLAPSREVADEGFKSILWYRLRLVTA